MWQDWVISIGQWVFIFALIPTLRHPTNKPELITSILTGATIAIFAATFATLEFWSATLSSTLLSVTWFVIGYQRYRLNRGSK